MEMLPRPKLLEKLAERSISFIGIIAPHGYGKTTLQRQYFESDPDSIYVQLSDADPTPVEIARLIGQALTDRFGKNTDYRMQFEMRRLSLAASGASGAVAHDLNLRPCTVIIDETHLLDNEGRNWFLTLFPKLNSKVRFIFAMHGEENLRLAHLQARSRVSYLTTEDLKFTALEMGELGLDEQILNFTDGWPAAVMLTRNGLNADLVAESILSTLPEPLLRDIRRMSLVTTWSMNDQLHQAMQLHDGWLQSVRLCGVPVNRVGADAFQPHTIIRTLLLNQLRERPQEYQEAQRILAGALSVSQPLTAAEAYLAAGEREKARQLLLRNSASLELSETTADAYDLLEQIQPQIGDPLHYLWIKARFMRGHLVPALEMAELATRQADPQHKAQALATLGQLRLRVGNVAAAALALKSAAELLTDDQQANAVRAELALALALASRIGGTVHADEAIRVAMMVRASASLGEQHAFSDAVILAHTAQMLANARKGMRVLARERAEQAWASLKRRSGGQVVMSCLLHVAGFLADEGDAVRAQETFEMAARLYPLDIRDESLLACTMTLTKARLRLRMGSTDALPLADRALRLALQFNDDTLIREARYLHLACVLVTGRPPIVELHALRFKTRSDDFTPTVARFVETVFVQRQELSPRDLHLVQSLPLDIRALVLLGCVRAQANPDTARPWLTDLVEVRRALGPGAVMQYAESLGVELPAHLSLHLNLNLEVLRGKPRATLNGMSLGLKANQMAWLIAAAFSPGQTLKVDELNRLSPESKKNFSNVKRPLRDALAELTGRSDAVQLSYGSFGLSGWQITSDVERLDQCGPEELEMLYRSEVFGDLGKDFNVLVDQVRRRARQTVVRRLRFYETRGQDVTELWEKLIRRDPALRELFIPRNQEVLAR